MGANHASAARLPGPAQRSLHAFSAALILGLLAVALAAVVYRFPPPAPAFLVLGGVGTIGVLCLAVARYDAAVALGFLLFGVVKVEPAPPDLVFAAVICVAMVTGRFRLDRVPLTVGALLGLFVALNLLSMIEAVDTERAAAFMGITLYLAVFSIWFSGYLDSESRARLVVIAYLITASVSAALGLLALLGALPGGDAFLFTGERAQGLFKDPNVFGPFMVPIALVLLEEIVQPRLIRIPRAATLLLLNTLALAIVFSFSRAAWLNAGVALVVLVAVLGLRRGGAVRSTAVLSIVLAAAGIASAVVLFSGSESFLGERAGLQTYDVQRFGAQEVGIELAEQHPAGIGPGQFESLSPISAHSTYVRVLAEQGVLGVVAFFGLSLATLVFALRNATLGRHTWGIGSAALLAAWCGIVANSLFVDTLHWRHLWLVAALIWVAAMRRPTVTSG